MHSVASLDSGPAWIAGNRVGYTLSGYGKVAGQGNGIPLQCCRFQAVNSNLTSKVKCFSDLCGIGKGPVYGRVRGGLCASH